MRAPLHAAAPGEVALREAVAEPPIDKVVLICEPKLTRAVGQSHLEAARTCVRGLTHTAANTLIERSVVDQVEVRLTPQHCCECALRVRTTEVLTYHTFTCGNVWKCA